MARTFNCGVGMVAVVGAENGAGVVADLERAGEQAFAIGDVRDGPRGCTVRGTGWCASEPWSAAHNA